jgi:hypothetical protein
MTDAELIQMLRKFYEGLFPKVCSNCGRRFATLREYIEATQRLWPSLDYDIELGDLKTLKPIGGLAMANCLCGTTMALSTKEMPLSQTHLILEWIRTESERRGSNPTEILDYLRDEVRKQVLAEPAREETTEPTGGRMPDRPPAPTPVSDTPAAGLPPRQP